MPIVTRVVPHGTVTADQLLTEIRASASLIGAACDSVAVWPGQSDDTIEIGFDAGPNDAELDAVIAAHPVFAPGLVSTVQLTSGDWSTVWSTLLAEGESAEVDGDVILRLGNSSTLEPVTIHYHGMGLRRAGGQAEIQGPNGGGDEVYGWVPQTGARLVATGNRLDLQVTARRTGTADVEGEITVERKVTT